MMQQELAIPCSLTLQINQAYLAHLVAFESELCNVFPILRIQVFPKLLDLSICLNIELLKLKPNLFHQPKRYSSWYILATSLSEIMNPFTNLLPIPAENRKRKEKAKLILILLITIKGTLMQIWKSP